MRTLKTSLAALLIFAAWMQLSHADAPDPDPQRFKADFEKFDAADKANPPAPGKVLFLGSSTIRFWKIDQFFPELDALNRGFGGSHVSDSVTMFDKLVVPYKPSTIVFYAGDNDIAGKKTPEQVRDDFKELLDKIRTSFPDCKVIVIGIKPSVQRWAMWEDQKKTNELIKEVLAKDSHGTFFDVADTILGADGKPKPEMFIQDGLHVNDVTYKIWAERLAPLLKDAPKLKNPIAGTTK
jgi:lysophospholipase L1-like esterase